MPEAWRRLAGLPERQVPDATPAAGPVEPPEYVADVPAALALWLEVGPDLAARGVLDGWSRHLFGRWCWCVAVGAGLRRDLAAEPLVESARGDGERVKSKLWMVLRQVDDEAARQEVRLGLSPADRGRVVLVGVEPAAGARDPERLLS